MKGDFNLGKECLLQKLCVVLTLEVSRAKLMLLDQSELNVTHRLAAITFARLERSELERASNMKNS